MNLNSIWSVLEESSEILGDHCAYPAMGKTVRKLSLLPDWFTWVAAINLFASNSFTIAQFMRIFPYGLAQVNEESFAPAIQITSAGKQVRAEVEAETERLFFAPWSCLNESELEELASLASQLREGLHPQRITRNT
jgi:hypothetical protein